LLGKNGEGGKKEKNKMGGGKEFFNNNKNLKGLIKMTAGFAPTRGPSILS